MQRSIVFKVSPCNLKCPPKTARMKPIAVVSRKNSTYEQRAEHRSMASRLEEPTTATTSKDEMLDWKEEGAQWASTSAAERTRPALLELKVDNSPKLAERSKSEFDVRKLAFHLMKVKRFLVELSELDKDVVKSKGRYKRVARNRKLHSGGCRSGESSVTRGKTRGNTLPDANPHSVAEPIVGSLLDPQIMRQFGSLIKSPDAEQGQNWSSELSAGSS